LPRRSSNCLYFKGGGYILKTAFLAPGNLDEVLKPLREDPDGTMLMAGGTALLWAVGVFGKPVTPQRVISLHNLTGLLGRVERGPVIELGALVSLATIAGELPEETAMPSILTQAARSCGYPAIRRTATLGGNLAHDMVSQLIPPLAVLGASVHMKSSAESRLVELGKSLGEGVGYPICSAGEIIISVSLPADSAKERQSYLDFTCPGKFPVVVASAFSQGILRVALLADQKVSLWATETDGGMLEKQEIEMSDAACASFGLTDESSLGEIDVYRRRGMVAKALRLLNDNNSTIGGV
jgi:CO/xanthine dehydrogenase FAD-binding subunit